MLSPAPASHLAPSSGLLGKLYSGLIKNVTRVINSLLPVHYSGARAWLGGSTLHSVLKWVLCGHFLENRNEIAKVMFEAFFIIFWWF